MTAPSGDAPAEEFAPDELLLAVAQRSDREAFATLFGHYAPRIKGHLITLGTSPGLADELTQEVMLTVWRKAHLFDPSRGAASTWIFVVARNCRVNHLRVRSFPQVDDDDPALANIAAAENPEQQLAAAEDAWVVGRAMAVLPTEQREVLRGAYFRGRTLRELADEQRVALGTVKTRVRLALGRLRRVLQLQEGASHDRNTR